MKYKLIIDENQEESITIIAKKDDPIFEQVRKMINSKDQLLIGYNNEQMKIINKEDVYYINCEEKVYIYLKNEKYDSKKRLYQLENLLDNNFIKINQSCIVNIKYIDKFKVSFSGQLEVVLKNGYTDYISRRQLKSVKERVGLIR